MKKKILPQIKHLINLTDNIGLIEHTEFNQPSTFNGYCVDDNARAIQVVLKFYQSYPILEPLLYKYFKFVKSAQTHLGLHNDFDDQKWKNDDNSIGEHFGRAIFALGELSCHHHSLSVSGANLFDKLYQYQNDSHYLRTKSDLISGLYYRLLSTKKSSSQVDYSKEINRLADSLVDQYQKNKSPKWHWFENIISYDNAKIPSSLFLAFLITKKEIYFKTALESLDFLIKKTFNLKLNCFSFPGNNGWFTKDGHHANFDQQPLEVSSTVNACLLAFNITGKKKYQQFAKSAMNWFHGQNIIKKSIINPTTGGVYDGFCQSEVNQNQGAESILSYLLASSYLL